MSESGYNGHKNRETWVMALHLDNDRAAYRMMVGLAQEQEEDGPDAVRLLADRVADEIERTIESALDSLSNGWVRMLVRDLLPSMTGDTIDWLSIAEGYADFFAGGAQ